MFKGNNVNKLIVVRVLSFSLGLAVPTIVLFWRTNGLSVREMLLLQAIFAVVLAVFELPSGYIADRLGRKLTIVSGMVLILIGTALYGLGQGFNDFLMAELLFAFSRSLISGADEALIFESLVERGETERYETVLRNAATAGILSGVGYCVVGAYLATVDLRLPYVFATALSFLGVLIAASVKESQRMVAAAEHGHIREVLSVAWRIMVKQWELGWMVTATAVSFGFVGLTLWFYQPYFEHCGLEVKEQGWAFAVFSVVAAFSARRATMLENRLGVQRLCLLLLVAVAGGFTLLANTSSWWGFLWICIHQSVRGIGNVACLGVLNRNADSALRATTLSVKSMAERFVYTVILVIVGFGADQVQILRLFALLGLATVVLAVLLVILRPRPLTKALS